MKFTKLILLAILLTTTSCAYDEDDNLVNTAFFNEVEVITTDSDLFENLKQIATNEERPDQNITCINFNYPLTLFVFDDFNQFESVNSILDDEQFSSFLETLNLDYSISVSFPITSTLDTGEEFIITSKEELKNSIDNCLGEELVFECNQLLQNCLWKVGYSYNFENPYLGALFQELNGFTTFNNQNTLVAGSWTVFLIENELHLNIGLVNDTEASEFFNYDWKVEYLDANSLLLKNEDREVILNQRCDDDFTECTNFIFEVCENDAGGGISNFILDDYKFCIFDTLELSEDLPISFFQTEEDANNNTNMIPTNQNFNNINQSQIIYGRINDEENESIFIFELTLKSISC